MLSISTFVTTGVVGVDTTAMNPISAANLTLKVRQ